MAREVVRAIDVLRDPELHRIRTKRTPAIKLGVFASEGRHREEMERFRPSLKELMLLVRLDQQHDAGAQRDSRSEEHTSELQSLTNLVCRLLLEKKKKTGDMKQQRVIKTQV